MHLDRDLFSVSINTLVIHPKLHDRPTSLKLPLFTDLDCWTDLCSNQAPLCVEGWDEALHEIGRLSHETILSPQNATSLLKAVEDMPVLVIAGAEDAHISLKSSQAMASKLVNSVSSLLSICNLCSERLNLVNCRGNHSLQNNHFSDVY